MKNTQIVIIHGDLESANRLRHIYEEQGFFCYEAHSKPSSIDLLARMRPDLVVIAKKLLQMDNCNVKSDTWGNLAEKDLVFLSPVDGGKFGDDDHKDVYKIAAYANIGDSVKRLLTIALSILNVNSPPFENIPEETPRKTAIERPEERTVKLNSVYPKEKVSKKSPPYYMIFLIAGVLITGLSIFFIVSGFKSKTPANESRLKSTVKAKVKNPKFIKKFPDNKKYFISKTPFVESPEPAVPNYEVKDIKPGTYSLQVAAYRTRVNARDLVEFLIDDGYRAFFMEIRKDKGNYYRVFVGQYSSMQKAKNVKDMLWSKKKMKSMIRQF